MLHDSITGSYLLVFLILFIFLNSNALVITRLQWLILAEG
jgi:hypothetical protein